MRVRKIQRYDETFRAEALALLERTDRTLTRVAADLGIPNATLRYWQGMAKKRKGPKPLGSTLDRLSETASEKLQRLERENQQLRKKVEDLEMDRAILKKAAAFFAKESE